MYAGLYLANKLVKIIRVQQEEGHIRRREGHIRRREGHIRRGEGHIRRREGHIRRKEGHIRRREGHIRGKEAIIYIYSACVHYKFDSARGSKTRMSMRKRYNVCVQYMLFPTLEGTK